MCAFHPAAPGSSPKHTIYSFIILSQNLCHICLYIVKRRKTKQKEAGICPLKKESGELLGWTGWRERERERERECVQKLKLKCVFENECWPWWCTNGPVVSVLAFYSDDSSLNQAKASVQIWV